MRECGDENVRAASFYDVLRACFGVRSEEGTFAQLARPASMSIAASVFEMPYAMAFLNVRNNMITDKAGFLDTVRNIIDSRGYKGFYYGSVPELGRQTARQVFRGPGVVFLPPLLKEQLPEEDYGKLASVLAGVGLAVVEATGTAPFEALKTYLTTKEGKGKGTAQARAFRPFAGYSSTLARQVVAWPLLFVSSDVIQGLVKERNGGEITYGQLAAIAPLVSACFIIPPYPFDVTKTLHQAAKDAGKGVEGKSPLAAVRHIVETEGVRALGRGALTAIVQRSPAAFIIMAMGKFAGQVRDDDTPILSFSELVARQRAYGEAGRGGKDR